MRVGIMLRHIGMRGGIGVYTRNLIEHLFPISPEDQFFLYYDCKDHLGRYAAHRNVVERFVPASSKLAWDQWNVPRRMNSDRLDVLFNPKLSVPLLGRVPSVFVLHGPEVFVVPDAYSRIDRLQARTLYPHYARKAAAVVVSTEDSHKKAMQFLRADPAKVHNISPGVSAEFRPLPQPEVEAVRAKYGLPREFFLFVGGLYPIKNFGRIVQALKLVKDRMGPATPPLVAVGFKRWRMDQELASIANLGLSGDIHFPGFLPDEDLVALYNAATAFVFPSLYEGFGLAALEALACGCPLVTSNVGGTEEIGRGAALLVDPHRPEQIAEALMTLLTNGALREDLKRKGLARAATYSWAKMAQEVQVLLRQVATGSTAVSDEHRKSA